MAFYSSARDFGSYCVRYWFYIFVRAKEVTSSILYSCRILFISPPLLMTFGAYFFSSDGCEVLDISFTSSFLEEKLTYLPWETVTR